MRRKDCWQARRGGSALLGRISRAGLGGLLVEVPAVKGMGLVGRMERTVLISEKTVVMHCGVSLPCYPQIVVVGREKVRD